MIMCYVLCIMYALCMMYYVLCMKLLIEKLVIVVLLYNMHQYHNR